MPTIYRLNGDRISVADAKRLILESIPTEPTVSIFVQVDEHGNSTGNIRTEQNMAGNVQALHLEGDFVDTCKQLGIQPRMKHRPAITDYNGAKSQDDIYTIAHDEFVRFAELFNLSVAIGKEPEPEAAPVVAANARKWTPEFLATVKAYRDKHGAGKAAVHFGVSEQLIRRKLPRGITPLKGVSAFTHRI